MMKPSSRLAVVGALLFVAVGCAGAERLEVHSQVDSGVAVEACVPTAILPAATCAEGVLSRNAEPTELMAGSATVLRLEREVDGRASLALETGTNVTTLSLPAAPDVTVGDTLTVELPGSGAIVVRSEGDLVVYVGPRSLDQADASAPVDRSSLLEANRDGTPLAIDVAGVPLTLEASCGGLVLHQGWSYGCPDVPMVAFSVRHGDTTVAPGARAVAALDDDRMLAIENRGIHVREDDTTCAQCADLWPPGFGLTLVVTAAE